ncbi:hypothetical protein Peur_015996 [Populus x canadensis]
MLLVVPVASMLTPNQFEAEILTGSRIVSEQDSREACNRLHAAGHSKVLAPQQRTMDDYRTAGYDPQASSLETRLIQSQHDIRHPLVEYKAEKHP